MSYRNSCLALQSGTTPSSSGVCDGQPIQDGALWSEGYKDTGNKDTNDVEESGAQGAERVHEGTADGAESALDEPLTTGGDASPSPPSTSFDNAQDESLGAGSTTDEPLEPAPTASESAQE